MKPFPKPIKKLVKESVYSWKTHKRINRVCNDFDAWRNNNEADADAWPPDWVVMKWGPQPKGSSYVAGKGWMVSYLDHDGKDQHHQISTAKDVDWKAEAAGLRTAIILKAFDEF